MKPIAKTPLVLGTAAAAACLARAAWKSLTAYSFRNRVVVITGGSRGLGLLMARQLGREGARLALCARDPDELQRAENELREMGCEVFTRPTDLTRPEELDQFFSAVRHQLGPVDVLINNAGVIQVGPLQSMTQEDYRQAMEIHFWAAVNAVNRVLPDMQRRGEGRIVNISSIGGKIAMPHLVPYCASKFALAGFSRGLRTELTREGILVTTVFPGLTRTGSFRNGLFKGRHRQEYTWFSVGASIPLATMNADRAARQIIDACRQGRADITLSLPAKMAVVVDALAPGLFAAATSVTNRLLPRGGGIGKESAKGWESESFWSPSWLTTLGESAAQRNNEGTYIGNGPD